MKGLIFIIASLIAFVNTISYKEELLLVVEVSRHGARSSKQIYDFTVDPEQNFKNFSELT
jgi:hypothetical protein